MIVKIRKPKNRGGAFVLMMGIGVAMMILSLTMILTGGHGRLIAARTGLKIRARSAADAGMADAIFNMNKKLIDEAVWDNSTLPTKSAGIEQMPASFNYSVSGSPPSFTISSTGTCSNMQENVYALLGVGSYWKGIGVREDVDVYLGTELGTIPAGEDLVIRTNSTEANAMTFKAFVTIPGDVICGPGGDVDTVVNTKATTVIEGEIYAAADELLFPSVLPPDPPLPYRGSITAATTQVSVDGQYDMIDVPQGGRLEVTAPCTIYVTGNAQGVAIILGQDSELIIGPNGSLNLYLGGNLEDKNSMGVDNQNMEADTFRIFGLPGCLEMDLKAKSNLYAAIYAPEADINLFNSGDFIGSIVGNSFSMKNAGRFLYDTNLASVFIDDPAAVFDLVQWWED